MMENEARSTVENVVKATVGRIDRQMASVESAVENSAWIVAERISDPDYMFKITGELVQNNPFIVGSTIAFEPNFFPSKGYYYSAFSCKDGTGGIKRIQQGGETFKYHGMDWYRIPKESKKSSWCEPYFDEGGAEVMMCTYSVPLMKRDGTVYAVLTADVSLDDLTHHVAGIKPYPDSYAVLFSQEGKPLVAAPAEVATANDTVKIAGKASNGWTVELVCPLANILQGARSLVWRIVVFSVVGLGLIFFVSWSFSTRLQRATVANERLSSELGIARTIQSSVLKRKVPPYLGTILRPAREVGGDFYDFCMLDDEHLYFAMCDVSGKGVPAALCMMSTRTILRSLATRGLAVEEILARANKSLCENNQAGMFVTALIGILEVRTGTLRLANAGHNPPVLRPPGGANSFLRLKSGLVLGGMAETRFRVQEIRLAPGEMFYCYTDGVTEAQNHAGELFGEKRLLATLPAVAEPTEALRTVDAAVAAYENGAAQADDLTHLCIVYHGS
jgi:hypothetical protein